MNWKALGVTAVAGGLLCAVAKVWLGAEVRLLGATYAAFLLGAFAKEMSKR